MKVLVLGGDGFCGWPTALHLSNVGHDVIIVDNLSRRKIDIELEVESPTPIAPMSKRLDAWVELTGKHIPASTTLDVAHQYPATARSDLCDGSRRHHPFYLNSVRPLFDERRQRKALRWTTT